MTGGMIEGNCAIGSPVIETRPRTTVTIEITMATMGLSTKKRAICGQRVGEVPAAPGTPAAGEAAAVGRGPGGAGPSSAGAGFAFTVIPGCMYWRPATITFSPAFSPL